jgi:predicted transcriptional regulator
VTNFKDAAQEYHNKGLNIVAVKQKKPLVEWACWQTRKQTQEEFDNQPWKTADSFAIVCGTQLKNGLFAAVVDFDVKNVSEEAQAKGKQILKQLLTTQIEETPSGGQHWIYQCHTKSRTISSYHNECGLELLGEGKLCIMAPTQGYKRLNDNKPTVLLDLETELYEAMYKAGFKPKTETPKTEAWFDRKDLSGKRFTGKTPPCIEALYRGAVKGERNEQAIRLASFLANFRKIRPDNVLEQTRKVNRLNEPPLEDQELQGIIRSAVNGGYVYGCLDPFLKRNCCRDECPIAPANIAKMLSKEETERAEKLLTEAKLLDHALSYGKRRLIGEDDALCSNFVMFCSGHTKYPISGVVSGFSGSGKNESIRAIKPLIPKEWYFEFTTSTPEAMKYLPEDFDGTLLIYEALGVKGDSGSLSLRAIGEGESIETIYPMRNELTGKMEMGRAKTNAKNFITTSSDIDINPDLYRRVLKHTMNHSTRLTKRVMAKKLRDATYPDSLRNALGLQKELAFREQDFQNALRLLNWKIEVVVFTPPELLRILDLAVKREQEVALRTHVEKIINFTKAIALLNQRKRLHVKVGELEFVVAEPNDFHKALEILRTSIMETVSRIEKRQEEALCLFTNSDVSLDKNDVASKLKVSTKTATRMLKTLAQAGYLKEEAQGKTYQYQLLQKEPNHLDLLENIRSFNVFHQNSLRNWLNTIETTGHVRGIPIRFKYSVEFQEGTMESNSAAQLLEHYALLPPPDTSTCPVVQVPSEANSGLKSQIRHIDLDNIERSTFSETKLENSQESALNSIDDFASVYWSDEGFGWHQCGVCGYTKLTCYQGETFKKDTVWLCEECQTAWEKRSELN